MAGADPRFDAERFREAIRFAMRMGSPNKVEDKATFHFPKVRTWPDDARLDRRGFPFDPSIEPLDIEPDPVVLDEVAVEFSQATPEETPVGNVKSTKVVLTMLDEDYERVRNARTVTLEGGDQYLLSYEQPVMGLFDVDVHQVVAFALDES